MNRPRPGGRAIPGLRSATPSLSDFEFARLTRGARVLHRDGKGVRIWLTPDDDIVKLFYSRSGWSSDRIWPYALRFVHYARLFNDRGIRAPRVRAVYRVPDHGAWLAIYPCIPGRTLREHFADRPGDTVLLLALARLFGTLHAGGIYCKALHLGNVLHCDDGELAVIDLAYARRFRRPVSLRRRLTNFRNLIREPADVAIFTGRDLAEFYDAYASTAAVPPRHRESFRQAVLAQMQGQLNN